ncbi:hypothetical protein LT85_0742 [Collimonas arenae]|uniref:Uncharacterized protein n=1 Tax=Collimonas arenae TaxID=279058 RepID=A0A0A1FAK6_9BURK|nr:hypothetical protein [Collimonas arenae]AIY39902.1 hypothetical protein LT85_0742 [Collimonas arenae]
MNASLMSFLLVLLVEAISVIASYLKDRLNRHMRDRDQEYGFDQGSEFA